MHLGIAVVFSHEYSCFDTSWCISMQSWWVTYDFESFFKKFDKIEIEIKVKWYIAIYCIDANIYKYLFPSIYQGSND